MIVIRPIVPIHLRFVFIDVVREDHVPILLFERDSNEADSREELGGT
jgi:hypothetical protein